MNNKIKNRIKYLTILLFVLLAIFILWTPLSLQKVSNRPISYTPDKQLKAEIKMETLDMSAEEIYNYSIRKTAKLLSYSTKNNLAEGKANCCGYAQMCAGISNYAFKTNSLNSSAKPVVGYVMFCNINVCDILKACMPNNRWKNFVKDHDFVEFHIGEMSFYADANAYDFLWKDLKTIK